MYSVYRDIKQNKANICQLYLINKNYQNGSQFISIYKSINKLITTLLILYLIPHYFHVIRSKFSIYIMVGAVTKTFLTTPQTTFLTGCSAWDSPSSTTGSAGTPTPTSSPRTCFAPDSCMEVPVAAKWVGLSHSEHTGSQVLHDCASLPAVQRVCDLVADWAH